jgi:hypothetical protein
MKRALRIGAAVSALVVAAMVPWSVSQAHGVSVGISTPEFGIRIGAPHYPVYHPAPVYVPPPVVYVPPPRYVVPPPRVIYGVPYYYPRYGHYHRHPHYWRHHHSHHRGHHRHDHDRRWR